MEVDVAELTDAQARELRRFARRAKWMYEDRQGGKEITHKLRPLLAELDDFDGELRFGFGFDAATREQIADIIEIEIQMERRKKNQGWGLDGRKLNAAENALKSFRDTKKVEVA